MLKEKKYRSFHGKGVTKHISDLVYTRFSMVQKHFNDQAVQRVSCLVQRQKKLTNDLNYLILFVQLK